VFAVCVFSDGTLIDHKGADSMSDCLKTKRLVEKKWKNKAADVDTIEINGIEYQIDGEALQFICDLVDAHVHRYADGTWEIISILGKHKKDE
jgi:predicted amidohydrolase